MVPTSIPGFLSPSKFCLENTWKQRTTNRKLKPFTVEKFSKQAIAHEKLFKVVLFYLTHFFGM